MNNKLFLYILPLGILVTVLPPVMAQNIDYISDSYTFKQYNYLRGNDQYHLYEIADLSENRPQNKLHTKHKIDLDSVTNTQVNEMYETSAPLFLSKWPAANPSIFQDVPPKSISTPQEPKYD